jgi:hypothetical protein
MNQDQIKKIIDIRNHVIGAFNALEGKHEPTAVVKQSKIAYELEVTIKKIDKILKDYVNFS